MCGGVCTGANIHAAPTNIESYINVRPSASTSGSSIGTYGVGSRFRVYGYSSSSTNWYRIQYSSEGYVNADYVALCQGFGYVNTASGTLNLRSGPGTGYSALRTIPHAQTNVCVLSGESGGWIKVAYGSTGYVSSEYFVINESTPIPAVNYCN